MLNHRPLKTLAALLLILTACAPSTETPQSGPDPVELKLAEALAETARANAAVAKIEQSALPAAEEAKPREAEGESPEFEINWTGPLVPLLHSLASHAGYSVEAEGAPPANPPVITVTGFRGPLAGAVRKINISLFGIGRVTADHDQRKIKLTHAGQSG